MKKLIKFFDSNIYKSITAIMLIIVVIDFYLKINWVLNLFDKIFFISLILIYPIRESLIKLYKIWESQIPTLKIDVKNFFDYDSIPEYWTVLNICY